ncbi:Saccharopine dehydrogenase-domain-containing protein [Pisolithus croceorrhizus]|nr:Saccharopine dehydrogenase-domain-containing protein [Pisolithus croceorrhizus]
MPAVGLIRRSPRTLSGRLLKHASQRSLATVAPPKLTIGIRREDSARIWERRCPLTPDAVQELVQQDGVDVLVQPCDRRVFPVDHFLKAGAKLHPTLEPAHVIIGIKETPLNELITAPVPAPQPSESLVHRTYLMFSHTIKGQPYNMPLLSRFLGENNSQPSTLPRLIDYELLSGSDGKRTVGFGWFAGVAGALESLSALAHAHLEIGVASPFLHAPRPHTHPSIPSLRATLRAIGQRISEDGTPKPLGAFVIGLTGNGQVSQGVLSILEELPIVKVGVKDLPSLVGNPETDLRKVYLVHASPEDYLSRMDGGQYNRSHYYQNPSLYKSDFATKVAPYLTLFLNGVGWLPGFPRLMTNEDLTVALNRAAEVGPARFGTIGDISCDIEGGLEFMPRASTLSEPVFKHRPAFLPSHLPAVHIMSVDILPTSLPLDASNHFSGVLIPYLRALVREYRSVRGSASEEKQCQYEEALERATVAKGGQLVGKHKWLREPVEKWRSAAASSTALAMASSTGPAPVENTVHGKKNVLMLGSGMVAGPAVQEICKREDVELVVASNSIDEAKGLTRHLPNAHARFLDVNDSEEMARLIAQADIVVSLLPVPLHPSVAELCIRLGKDMVTASYISPAMRALHERAESSGVLLLNEIGLDPGIDHCSAHSLLSRLRSERKRVLSLTSFCGGLPAPDVVSSTQGDDVPLGYKFSWSPRGVLSAALNGARFKLGGKEVEIPSEDILRKYFPDVPVPEGAALKFEGIANRDSFPYVETYGLGDSGKLRTVLRGTLRYPGFSDLMDAFKTIGLLSLSSPPSPSQIPFTGWTDLTRFALQHRLGTSVPGDHDSVRAALFDLLQGRCEEENVEKVIGSLMWLGIMPPRPTLPRVDNSPLSVSPSPAIAPIDLFAQVLAHKLRYLPSERDMVVLSHEIVVVPDHALDGAHVEESAEVHTSTLITFGSPRASAMATCVGLPVAFASLAILDGRSTATGLGLESGVRGPTEVPSVWSAVLGRLEEAGVGMKERICKVPGRNMSYGEGVMEGKLSLGFFGSS